MFTFDHLSPPSNTRARLHDCAHEFALQSRFHFNFAGWNGGPENFGVRGMMRPCFKCCDVWQVLRVVNDDLVKARSGFGTHPHRDMVRLCPRPCSRCRGHLNRPSSRKFSATWWMARCIPQHAASTFSRRSSFLTKIRWGTGRRLGGARCSTSAPAQASPTRK